MKRNAHCFFCDDIRYEVGNKSSLIGIYNGEMLIGSLPAFLPKLCIATFLSTPIDMPVSSLGVRVEFNGNILQEMELPGGDLAAGQGAVIERSTSDDPLVLISLGNHITISPFAFDKAGALTVTIFADGEEYIAGKLRIRVFPKNP